MTDCSGESFIIINRIYGGVSHYFPSPSIVLLRFQRKLHFLALSWNAVVTSCVLNLNQYNIFSLGEISDCLPRFDFFHSSIVFIFLRHPCFMTRGPGAIHDECSLPRWFTTCFAFLHTERDKEAAIDLLGFSCQGARGKRIPNSGPVQRVSG